MIETPTEIEQRLSKLLQDIEGAPQDKELEAVVIATLMDWSRAGLVGAVSGLVGWLDGRRVRFVVDPVNRTVRARTSLTGLPGLPTLQVAF